MSKPAPLTALSPLGGYSQDFDGIAINEVTKLAMVSLAIPSANNEAFAAALQAHYAVERPEVGRVTESSVDQAKLLGLQQDQLFVMFDDTVDDAVRHVAERINGEAQLAYLSDQSDSWVMLRLSGERCRDVLERICPLDLDLVVFPVGSVARTSMEHMSAMILHESDGGYLLMGLRSYARSFLHAVTESIANIT